MSDPHSYTIGWICAISTELVAAKAMLDHVHDDPKSIAARDDNSYVLGSIGQHNVAIAVLPDGEYGTSSAAVVVRDMIHSFPNLRIGLMVGIGGGAPTDKHDIRLGDVVVSSPQGGRSGVFQYDFGKTIQEQAFQYTGFLNQPPRVARNAVSALKSMHEEDGAQLDETINNVLSKKPRLKQKYGRPSPDSDRLYHSNIVHLDKEINCTGYCDHDPSNWKERAARSEFVDNPAIHYGLIASADQLMKDATVRDKLAKHEDVLCFEMEAAGLMNHFPCLVIRGICDYADSHKNKVWQGYAALAAAVYGRQLLAKVTPNKVESERRLADIISDIQTDVQETKLLTERISTGAQKLYSRQQKEDIREWLRPPDCWTNFNNAKAQRHAKSGSWLLNRSQLLAWMTPHSQISTQVPGLWLYGTSGCGKTVLSSTIIQALKETRGIHIILYFFFDFRDEGKQKLEHMLRALVSQLASQQASCEEMLISLFSSCGQGHRQPSCDELRHLLSAMMKKVGEVWIVIDALDESDSDNVLAWLKQAVNTKETIVHAAVTSQPEANIETVMNTIGLRMQRLLIGSHQIKEDIQSYVRFRMHNEPEFRKWQTRERIWSRVEASVLHEATGMFRLVSCRLDMLKDCVTEEELDHELDRLPDALGDVYGRMIQKIPHYRLSAAIRILQLLLFSPRPLQLTELADAIAVDTRGRPYVKTEKRPHVQDVIRYCPGLTVMVKAGDSTAAPQADSGKHKVQEELYLLQLSHLSVRDYLLSGKVAPIMDGCLQAKVAMPLLADICVSYLLEIEGDHPVHVIRQHFPFAQYCCSNWPDFRKTLTTVPEDLHLKIMTLLRQDDTQWRTYTRLLMESQLRETLPLFKDFTALCYAALLGLLSEVRTLLQHNASSVVVSRSHGGEDVSFEGGTCGPALIAASMQGHKEIVELLLDQDPDIDAQRGTYRSALIVASERGHKETLKLLLDRRVDVKRQERYLDVALQTALQAACITGDRETARILLERGADVNARGGLYGSALQAASGHGSEALISELLDRNADVNIQGGPYGSALIAAVRNGFKKIVKLLLERGADVNTSGCSYGSALVVAVDMNDKETVQLLLDRGANVNIQGDIYGPALQLASTQEHREIVKLFLDTDVDIDAQGGKYGFPLQAASLRGNRDIIQLLLDQGADINACGGLYGSALQAASRIGHQDIVQILLDRGADVNVKGGESSSALQAACIKGHQNIVQTLLDRGADVNIQGGKSGSALQAACTWDNQDIAQLLLDRGADVNAQGGLYGSALQAACSRGHPDLVQLLLDRGADVNAYESTYGPALQVASIEGRQGIVRLLLDQGADVNAHGSPYASALVAACDMGYPSIVQTLIDRGADLNKRGPRGSALQAASKYGRDEIVQMLLKHGARSEQQEDNHDSPPRKRLRYESDEEIVKLKAKVRMNPPWSRRTIRIVVQGP